MHNNIELLDKTYSWKLMSLFDFLQEGNIPSNWSRIFNKDTILTELHKISSYLQTQQHCMIYPPIYQVFRIFYLNTLNNIKVVIIGMDPYHNGTTEYDGSAVGLSFSVAPGNTINPSLKNIYKELEQEGYTPCKDGNLVPWAKQGVFLYNMALTVEKGNPDSHTELWYNFSEKIIEYISDNTKNVCWLLFGKRAQAIESIINKKNHKIIKTSHPSPFSCNRGFLGSNCFREANNYLQSHGKNTIKW